MSSPAKKEKAARARLPANAFGDKSGKQVRAASNARNFTATGLPMGRLNCRRRFGEFVEHHPSQINHSADHSQLDQHRNQAQSQPQNRKNQRTYGSDDDQRNHHKKNFANSFAHKRINLLSRVQNFAGGIEPCCTSPYGTLHGDVSAISGRASSAGFDYNRPVSDSYRQLIEQVNKLTDKLSSQYAQHLVCRSGCSGCCHHHLSVFAVEAATVRTAIEALPESVRVKLELQAHEVLEWEARGKPVACPMLVDDRCAIYESRPLICRTQGLPLLIEVEDGEAEVDFCPLNFTAENALDVLDEHHLVPLDDLNLKLALVNLQHCREQGIADEFSGQRLPMAKIILQSTAC